MDTAFGIELIEREKMDAAICSKGKAWGQAGYPGALYHVTSRGIARAKIYTKEPEAPTFLSISDNERARKHSK